MKNISVIVAVTYLFLLFSLPVSAQKGTLKLDINYNYSIPLSGFKTDLISENSPRGLRAGLMYSFNDKFSGGLSVGYQDYYQKYPRAIYALSKTQDISAVLTNSIQTTPFLLKAKYVPVSKESFIKPYISLGAGANVIDFKQYFGEFASGQTNVGFIAEGGLGVVIPFKKYSASGIHIGATYDYAPYTKYGYHDLSSLNFQAGVAFRLQ